jgi:hypothetical protein
MKPRPDIVAAMELLLTPRQRARILELTYAGPDRVAVLRQALNLGLDQLELKFMDRAELAAANPRRAS